MAGAENTGRRREPLVLGVTGALIGVALAVALLVFTGFGGTSTPAGASPSPTTVAGGSAAPSPSLVAGASVIPTAGATVAPPSAAASAVPTAAPAKTPRPTATANTGPVIVSWDVPKQEDCTGTTGGKIQVSWTVQRASGVTISIDGPGIFASYAGLTGEIDDLPFGCDATDPELEHTYTLTTVGGTGPAATLTRTVRARAPSVVSFEMGQPDCGPGDTFVGISMSFEVRAATGAQLKRGAEIYSNYNNKATDDIVLYDCALESQVWTLTTTGGYGPAASKPVTVDR